MKRIILCADGTWNFRDQVDEKTGTRHPTNVTKVARGILPLAANGTEQVVYYHEGVGTAVGLDHLTGGAFGEGIETNIRELYRFLVYNYDPGDEVYFFGFSRGAFTVRTLAGFMNKFGLLNKGDDYCVPDLYDCYESGQGPDTPEWTKAFRNVRNKRPCPPIKFIGVWDTVGALGAPGALGQIFNKNKYQYHDVQLNPNIQNAYHALAIDEHRAPFTPNLWTRPPGFAGTLQQAWFAGVHCNVGGGYSPDGLANEALHWMVEKAEGLGLEFDSGYLDPFKPCFNSLLQESKTGIYLALGDYVRPIGEHLADGEVLHRSALDRKNLAACNYHPQNLGALLDKGMPFTTVSTTRVPTGIPCS
jgi:uncharacterized protein (DUF2235 family)